MLEMQLSGDNGGFLINENRKEFGKKIKFRRLAKGWDQSQLARSVGSTATTVGRWENAKTVPRPHNVVGLKRELGLTEEDFLKAFGENRERQNSNATTHSLDGDEYVDAHYDGSYENFVADLFRSSGDTMATTSPIFWGSVENRAPIFKQSPSTWKVLTHGGKIVGSWQFICLKRDAFARAMSRELSDSELTIQDVDFPTLRGNYRAYFTAIFINRGHDNPGTYSMIFKSITLTLESFAKEGVFLSDIVTHAVTPAGVALCKKIGFTHLGRHIAAQDTDIVECYHMSGEKLPTSFLGEQSTTLKSLYSARFG